MRGNEGLVCSCVHDECLGIDLVDGDKCEVVGAFVGVVELVLPDGSAEDK